MAFTLSQAGVGTALFGAGRSPTALASSNKMGAPRLHEWSASTVAALRTNKISSRVAPASSAARMWRRVPSGLRLVHATFKPTLINSTSFRWSNPLAQGLVTIFPQASAHAESHSRSCEKAASSQGPGDCLFIETTLAVASLFIFASNNFLYQQPPGSRTYGYVHATFLDFCTSTTV